MKHMRSIVCCSSWTICYNGIAIKDKYNRRIREPHCLLELRLNNMVKSKAFMLLLMMFLLLSH